MSRRTTDVAMFSARALAFVLGLLLVSSASYAGQPPVTQPQPGLRGDYFNDTGGTHWANGIDFSRVDPTVNFVWVTDESPKTPEIGGSNFSISWSGFILPTQTGNYIIRTGTDDGSQLFINGV